MSWKAFFTVIIIIIVVISIVVIIVIIVIIVVIITIYALVGRPNTCLPKANLAVSPAPVMH